MLLFHRKFSFNWLCLVVNNLPMCLCSNGSMAGRKSYFNFLRFVKICNGACRGG